MPTKRQRRQLWEQLNEEFAPTAPPKDERPRRERRRRNDDTDGNHVMVFTGKKADSFIAGLLGRADALDDDDDDEDQDDDDDEDDEDDEDQDDEDQDDELEEDPPPARQTHRYFDDVRRQRG